MNTLAVFDCMLFFSAAAKPKRVHPLFELVEKGLVTLCLDRQVLAELRDVLTRPKLREKYPALTTEGVDAFLAKQLRSANWLEDVHEVFVLQRDPKDSKYINLAIAAGAPYLVTLDRDLLDLMLPGSAAGVDFRSRFPKRQILSPAAFLAELARILEPE